MIAAKTEPIISPVGRVLINKMVSLGPYIITPTNEMETLTGGVVRLDFQLELVWAD